uniref:Pentacotripeptide-repeat region of PRORP domain-containing protein n=1 Tax=Aegilops tauschii TaxID=37682 RepID=M8C1W7_AEGTA
MGLLKNSLLLQGLLLPLSQDPVSLARKFGGTNLWIWRPYLLRDAYDDMLLDGVQPVRDTFHNLIVGTMKGSRLQDAFYFRDQMREMGLQPDLLEEMKAHGVKLKGETYICLLNALAATGRTDQVYAIVRDMTAAGLGLNKFCYAGLITAFKNKTPASEDTPAKILEFVQQSKGWQYVERVANDSAENIMMNVSEEELYNLPTAEFAHRRGFIFKQLTIYHVAIHACADLGSKETLEALLDMFTKENFNYDAFIVMQAVRCYLRCGDIDSAVKMFEEFSSLKPTPAELYVTLAEGAMIGYTPRGMEVAQATLEKMTERKFFLNPKMGTDLLLAASGEKTGGYTTANYIWDMLQTRNIIPALPAVEAYYKGLKEREIPSDDPRLVNVARVLDNLQLRLGPRRNFQ